MWQERADYGHFFYRIPNGESAADAYDRVSGFNESLWRQFGDDDFASVCVLVTHGLMSRVFLMKWYHFTVEYFEDLRNVDHCEFLIMRKQDNGKFLLETKLRTWSDLRRSRALAAKEKDEGGSPPPKDEVKLQRNKTFVVQRRWGGCPDGCNHSTHYTKRHDLDALRQREIEREAASTRESRNTSPVNRKQRPLALANSDDEVDDDNNYDDDDPDAVERRDKYAQHSSQRGSQVDGPSLHKPTISITNPSTAQLEALISSSEGTPTYLDGVPHVHMGRDFGGTYSGHASNAGSDTDASEDERSRHRRIASLNARLKSGGNVDIGKLSSGEPAAATGVHSRNYSVSSAGSVSAPGPGPFVNRLGDAPPFSDTGLYEEGVGEAEEDADADVQSKLRKAKTFATFTTEAKDEEEDEDEEGGGYVDPELDAMEAAENSVQESVY